MPPGRADRVARMHAIEGTLPDFHAIIPAGGVGSRLWPLSRAEAPKFLHDLTGSGHTLLRDTWNRILPLAGASGIMVVTGRAHRSAVQQQLPDLAEVNIVLESEPKDSSAAIGLAAAILNRRHPGVIVGSFAADHVISDAERFRHAVAEAVAVARAGYITTIGIAASATSAAAHRWKARPTRCWGSPKNRMPKLQPGISTRGNTSGTAASSC